MSKENRTLATLLGKVTQKKLKLQIRWVRGHIRDVGNSIADLGTRADSQHRWWKRVQPTDDWEENVFQAKILSPQRERAPCEQARCIQWTGAVDLPRINPMTQVQTPQVTLGRKMGSAKKQNSYLDPQGDTMVEMRRLCLERRREKGPCETEDPLHRTAQARQKMRRKQATLRCKEATQLRAPSRLKVPPPPTRAPILERVDESGTTEKVEHLDGRTDIVHRHFRELFTDHSNAAIPEWIEQPWPYEILLTLPMIDGARVREIAFEFRKRTGPRRQKSCGKHNRSPWPRKRMENSRCAVFARLPCCRRSTVSTRRHCCNWQDRLVRNTDTSLVDRQQNGKFWCS